VLASVLKTKLILFDIDGTLLTSGGAGERCLGLALQDRYGVENGMHGIEIAGRTDTGIAKQILRKIGVTETSEEIHGFLNAYLQHLARLLPVTKGRLLPGVIPLLNALRATPEVALGLLTGNLQRGAELKLKHYGIWDYFEFGAFADDHHDRNELGNFARSRARERHGAEFESANIYVIGDTPHDITCARAFGAKAIGVATGGSTREALAAQQPEALFDDLSDLPGVLAAFE
jgi:phosphoglycolate phosphatase-like HAD superfamily hydrolase